MISFKASFFSIKVRYLTSLGGGTLADSSKLLLRHCLDKEVAIEFSHQGKGKLKKKPLNATEFYKAYKGKVK
jgi:hypothetical protein